MTTSNAPAQGDWWGMSFEWPCGHTAIIMEPDHDITGHQHCCPVCTPDKTKSCTVEYLDLHLRFPTPESKGIDGRP